jgi:hypothetical protein
MDKHTPQKKHTPQACRWAEPTLFMPLPYWLDAWDMPWSCRRTEPTRLIESAEMCRTCSRWEARREEDALCDFAGYTPLACCR